MVREILHMQVGECGNLIGAMFWETVCKEHHLLEDGTFVSSPNKSNDQILLDKIGVYFRQNEKAINQYIPRSILIDLEPGIIDLIKTAPTGRMFKLDNFISGTGGAASNWGKGYYTEGDQVIEECMEVIRKEAELCDALQGFQITHSLGGGTGSGLGSLLLHQIRDKFSDNIIATYSVCPSLKANNVAVEPYNTILTIDRIIDNCNECFVIDNDALYNISYKVLKQSQLKYKELNWIASSVMAGITSSLRFPVKLNNDLRKMAMNLVPFPRLHFLLVTQAPLFAFGEKTKAKLSFREITDQMWSSQTCMANVAVRDGKYLGAALIYRGESFQMPEENPLRCISEKMAEDFVNWIPDNIKMAIVSVPAKNTYLSGTFIANTTSIKAVFQRISDSFDRMLKRKAFLHWYTSEGMDEMEFFSCNQNVRDMILSYQDKQDVVVDFDDEEEILTEEKSVEH
ncbi:beta-tubulin [Reticulomyxa filosa]|uniref:Tubulin beta chain n=1 Tax=Reticulomyxa filosa TaxID=46433 RepID=X6P6I0_RETFI|nr:beta-tubulin [Reticulomyxa filosa]|eukprot:ETO33694.1 beta-tubulin [Reticulomyxa filosa]